MQGCLGTVCIPIDVPITIYNPCLDVNIFAIQPVPMPDVECGLFYNCEWTHTDFMIIASSTTMIDFCGGISYDIDVDINISLNVSYDVSLHTIIFYCEDMGIVGQSFDFTINVVLTLYPDACGLCAFCCGSSTGTIIIVDPCIAPTIVVGMVVNIDFDFNGPSTFNQPPTVITPGTCTSYAVYTCTYISGPYSGSLDLCNGVSYNGAYYVTISFDVTTGVWIFDTDDTTTFVPGVYTFEITVTIGSTVQTVQFSLTIIGHCDVPTLTIVQQPISMTYYHLGEASMTVWQYNLQTIVSSTVLVPCGDPMVIFSTTSFFLVSDIFTTNVCIGFECEITIYTADVSFVGEYEIVFVFFYSGMPSVTVVSNVFTVIVVNPCIPPPGCIGIPGCGIEPPVVGPPDINIQIEVTVTVDVTYEMPPWTCTTPGCGTQVNPGCVNCDIGTGGVVVIVDNEINIHIDSCVDICTEDPNGNTIIIIVDGCLGSICTEIEIEIIVYNPCLDSSLVTIVPGLVPDISYTIYEDTCWQHEVFVIDASVEAIVEICGQLVYSYELSFQYTFITYDPSSYTICINTDDMTLIDISITYTINVVFDLYPDCNNCGSGGSGTVIIISPCVNPFINVGVALNVDFDFTGPAVFTPPVVVVNPSVCQPYVIYSCAYVTGPYSGTLDLCNYVSTIGISTSITFNIETGIWIFNTEDANTFPPGVYVFIINVTVGQTIVPIQFTLTIISHCEVPTLTLVSQPASPQYYIIGDAEMSIWTYDINAIVTSTLIDHCGVASIVFTQSGGLTLPYIF